MIHFVPVQPVLPLLHFSIIIFTVISIFLHDPECSHANRNSYFKSPPSNVLSVNIFSIHCHAWNQLPHFSCPCISQINHSSQIYCTLVLTFYYHCYQVSREFSVSQWNDYHCVAFSFITFILLPPHHHLWVLPSFLRMLKFIEIMETRIASG